MQTAIAAWFAPNSAKDAMKEENAPPTAGVLVYCKTNARMTTESAL